MAGYVPNVGEVLMLDTLRTAWNAGPATVHLYQNDYTPDEDSDVGDFTEADFDGYTALDCDGWTSPITGMDGRAYSQGDTKQWNADVGGTTPNTIYGYYVLDDLGNLLFAERFALSVTMEEDPDQLTLIPTFRLFQTGT